MTFGTVGAGLLHFALRRSHNVRWQDARHRQAGARRSQAPASVRRLADRAVGRGQVDDREPGRAQAARPRLPHLPARRRQPPSRPEQGPRIHRERPRREHPACGRGGEVDGRRRPDRHRRRSSRRSPAIGRKRGRSSRRTSSTRSSSTRRSMSPRSVTRRGSTRRLVEASCRTSPASTRRTSGRRAPICASTPRRVTAEEAAEAVIALLSGPAGTT